MKLETQDDQLMAMAAFRYCLGRRSYIVGSCIEWLRATWSQIGSNTQGVILRDIVEAIIDKYAGDPIDVGAWSALAKWGYSQLSADKKAWLMSAVAWKREPEIVRDILGIQHG